MKRKLLAFCVAALFAVLGLGLTNVKAQVLTGNECTACLPSLSVSTFYYPNKCGYIGFTANTSLIEGCETKGFSWAITVTGGNGTPPVYLMNQGQFLFAYLENGTSYNVCVEWHYGPIGVAGYCTRTVCVPVLVNHC